MAKSRQVKTAKKTKRAKTKPRRRVPRPTGHGPRATKKIPAEQGKGPIPGEVGYGQPPVEHQFRPGESGNPAGTPPARCNLWRHLCRFLEMTPRQLAAAKRRPDLTLAELTAIKQAEQLRRKGLVGVALPATLRMWDRDEGRPTARVIMETADVLSPEECDEIRAQLRTNITVRTSERDHNEDDSSQD